MIARIPNGPRADCRALPPASSAIAECSDCGNRQRVPFNGRVASLACDACGLVEEPGWVEVIRGRAGALGREPKRRKAVAIGDD